MPTLYVPKIATSDYQSFRRLIKDDMPESIEGWQGSQSRECDQYRLQWHPNGNCIDIEVHPNEFTRYCDGTQAAYTLEALDRFVFEKAQREGK